MQRIVAATVLVGVGAAALHRDSNASKATNNITHTPHNAVNAHATVTRHNTTPAIGTPMPVACEQSSESTPSPSSSSASSVPDPLHSHPPLGIQPLIALTLSPSAYNRLMLRGGSVQTGASVPTQPVDAERVMLAAAHAASDAYSSIRDLANRCATSASTLLALQLQLLRNTLTLPVIAHAQAASSAQVAPILPSSYPSSVASPDPAIYNPPAPPHDHWNSNWDGLAGVPVEVDEATKRPIHVTRHLIFIRHGQYVLPSKVDSVDRDVDPVLTEKGRLQAKLTAERLKALGYPISEIHCSTMARAKETAEIIAESFPGVVPQATDLLREGVPCAHVPKHPTWSPSPEEKLSDPPRIQQGFRRLVTRWRSWCGKRVASMEEWREIQTKEQQKNGLKDNGSITSRNADESVEESEVVPPSLNPVENGSDTQHSKLHSSGEGTIALDATTTASSGASHSAATASSSAAPSSIPRRLPPLMVDRYELIVCHGNVIRYSLLRLLQLPAQAWLRIAIFNCGLTHVTIRSDGHVSCRSVGDIGHLEKDLITYH